jgi:nickel-dependent lactate racemase
MSTGADRQTAAVKEALEASFSPELYADSTVTVVVPDATRPLNYTALAPLFRRLDDAGATTRILIGLGLHRPMDPREVQPLRRLANIHGARLAQHDAEAEDLVTVDEDAPAIVHPWIVDSDRVISVGTVEPHQYAGFSGGTKGVAIGCGGAETVSMMHGLDLLRDPGTRIGGIDDNPFRQTLDRLVEPLGAIDGLQLVPAPSGDSREETRAFFGPIDSAFEDAVILARTRFFQYLDSPLDWLHLPVPASKAQNVYQASRAATYAALVDRPAIRQGGTIIVEASCPEGIGNGVGEEACREAMMWGPDRLNAILEGQEYIETRGGQQRAFVLAMALNHVDIAFVGAPKLDALEAMGIDQFDTMDDAHEAGLMSGDGKTIENVFHSIPTLQ